MCLHLTQPGSSAAAAGCPKQEGRAGMKFKYFGRVSFKIQSMKNRPAFNLLQHRNFGNSYLYTNRHNIIDFVSRTTFSTHYTLQYTSSQTNMKALIWQVRMREKVCPLRPGQTTAHFLAVRQVPITVLQPVTNKLAQVYSRFYKNGKITDKSIISSSHPSTHL